MIRAQLDMTDASLSMSQQKVLDQAALLELSRKENQELSKSYDSQLRKERDDRHNAEV